MGVWPLHTLSEPQKLPRLWVVASLMETTVQRGQPYKPSSLLLCSSSRNTILLTSSGYWRLPFLICLWEEIKKDSRCWLRFWFPRRERVCSALWRDEGLYKRLCKSPSGCCPPLSPAGNYMFSVSPVLPGNTNIFCAGPCVFTWRGGACVKQVTLSRN